MYILILILALFLSMYWRKTAPIYTKSATHPEIAILMTYAQAATVQIDGQLMASI